MNLKAHTQLALKRGDGNSNLKASKQPAQDQYVTSSLRGTSNNSTPGGETSNQIQGTHEI
jgi:hypothetical protein